MLTLKELIIPASQGCKWEVVFGGKKCKVTFVKFSLTICTGALSTSKRFCDFVIASLHPIS